MSALLVAGLGLLAGCGGGTRTVIVGTPPRSAPTATVAPKAAAAQPAVSLGAFQSPSGNIGCMIIGASARCDIVHRSWSAPARPSSCPPVVDFGQGLIVGRSGAARVVCAGDTARDPTSPRLPYGSASEVEGFACVSRRTGMTCTARTSGHGFFLSAQSYRLF